MRTRQVHVPELLLALEHALRRGFVVLVVFVCAGPWDKGRHDGRARSSRFFRFVTASVVELSKVAYSELCCACWSHTRQ